jgi:hypothetical protein
MKMKVLIALSVAGTFAWSAAHAFQRAEAMEPSLAEPSSVSEVPASMSTMNSPDWNTGGYRGWGPLANPVVPVNVSENTSSEYFERMQQEERHLSEVAEAREANWMINAPLRAESAPVAESAPSRWAGWSFMQFFRR